MQPETATSAPHAFQRALTTRDFAAMRELLHPDVVLNSPILTKPFKGRESVLELFEVIAETLEDIRFTVDIGQGDIHVFSFFTRVGQTEAQGTDIVRVGEDGRIAEFTVFFRPLPAITALSAALGKRLASRKSRARGVFAGAASAPLVALSRATDSIAPRLVK